MKNHHLKIFSLIITILVTAGAVFAYQTLIFEFPKGENMVLVYHAKQGSETIVQYVPANETIENWTKSLILHSYNDAEKNASMILEALTSQLEKVNFSQRYSFIRANNEDAIATRCVSANKNMKAQCDIYRAMVSFNGIITIQYINRSQESFKKNHLDWLNTIKNAKPYYSNWRNDRVMDRETTFEL